MVDDIIVSRSIWISLESSIEMWHNLVLFCTHLLLTHLPSIRLIVEVGKLRFHGCWIGAETKMSLAEESQLTPEDRYSTSMLWM
jgi:hypothetical protein